MSDLISGFAKGMQAFGKGIVEAAEEVGKGVAGSVDELMKDSGKEFNDVGNKLQDGDVIGAGLEFAELIAPGTHVANALDAIGVLPDDPFAKNVVSAGVNLFAGGILAVPQLVAGFKDLVEAGSAFGTKGKPVTDIARPHWPPPPKVEIERTKLRPPPGYPGTDQIVTTWPMPRPPIRPGCPHGQIKDWIGGNPGFFRPLPDKFIDFIGDRFKGECEKIGFKPSGPSCRDKPINERTIEDILNDPNLTFEDMVAMFMAKVMDDMEAQVKDQMKKMKDMLPDSDGEQAGSASKAGGASAAGKTKELKAGESDFDKDYETLKQGAAGGAQGLKDAIPMLGGMLDILGPFAPMLGAAMAAPVGAAVGAAVGSIVPGAGTAIGAVVGGLVTSAIPVVLPMLVDGAKSFVKDGGLANMVDMFAGATDGGKKAESQAIRERMRTGEGMKYAGGTPHFDETGGAGNTQKPGGTAEKKQTDQNSFNIEMEQLKLLMQRMQQMQQALSNVLNTMHQGAMNAIRNIK